MSGVRVRLSLAPLVLLAFACEPETEGIDPIGVWTAPEAATSMSVLPASGTAPVRVAIRGQGSWGAAVPGDLSGVTLDGAPVEIQTDGGGVGVLTLDQAGVYTVAADNSVVVPVFAGALGLDVNPRALAQDTLTNVHASTAGAIGVSESNVWWIPAQGEAVSVVDVAGERIIAGSAAGAIDADGLTDVVVWSGGTVAVLRSHPIAGHVLAGTIEAEGRSVASAAIGDVDGDGLSDIVIAWSEAPRFELEVWGGDGAFNFTVDDTLRLRNAPNSVSIGDNTGEGRPQITVLDDTNFWVRFVRSGDTYAQTGPTLVDTSFPDASTSLSGDVNGDGADELFVIGPLAPTVQRDVRMFDLSDAVSVTSFESGSIGASVAVADSDRDGRQDVWLAQETGEVFVRRIPVEAQEQRSVWMAPDPGPIAVGDFSGDGIPELFVAGPTTWDTMWGGTATFDTGVWWAPADDETVFETTFTVPPVFIRPDVGSGRLDIVGMTESGANVDLAVVALSPGPSPILSELGTTRVSISNADGVAIAYCGGIAYALTTAEVVMVDLTTAPATLLGTADVTGGTVVACGEGPSSSTVGVLTAGVVSLFDDGGNAQGTETIAGAVDIGLAGGSVESCTTVGCSIAVLPDGRVVTSTADGVSVDDATYTGSGLLSVVDIDGDGTQEVLAFADGDLTVFDDAAASLVPRYRAYSDLRVDGGLATVDLFADGRRTLVGSRDGNIIVSTGNIPAVESDDDE